MTVMAVRIRPDQRSAGRSRSQGGDSHHSTKRSSVRGPTARDMRASTPSSSRSSSCPASSRAAAWRARISAADGALPSSQPSNVERPGARLVTSRSWMSETRPTTSRSDAYGWVAASSASLAADGGVGSASQSRSTRCSPRVWYSRAASWRALASRARRWARTRNTNAMPATAVASAAGRRSSGAAVASQRSANNSPRNTRSRRYPIRLAWRSARSASAPWLSARSRYQLATSDSAVSAGTCRTTPRFSARPGQLPLH